MERLQTFDDVFYVALFSIIKTVVLQLTSIVIVEHINTSPKLDYAL